MKFRLQGKSVPPASLPSRLFLFCLLAGFLFTVISLWNPAPLAFVNLQVCDLVNSTLEQQPPAVRTALVAIDDASLKQFGQWPWPRYRLAFLLQKIQESGALVVGVNILLPESDRTSLSSWRDVVAQDLGLKISIDKVPEGLLDHDVLLAKILRNGPFVLGYEFLAEESSTKESSCSPHPLVTTNSFSSADITVFKGKDLLCNTKVLADSTDRGGFLNGTLDPDGRMRRIPLLMQYQGQLYPSFDLSVLLRLQKDRKVSIFRDTLGILHLRTGPLLIGTDNRGAVLLNQGKKNYTDEVITAASILSGEFSPSSLKDRVVIVGLTASGFGQETRLHMKKSTSLPALHLHTIESLLSGKQPLRDEGLFRLIEAGLTLLLLMGLAPVISYFPVLISFLLLLVMVAGCWSGSILVLHQTHYLFSPFLPCLGLLVTGGLLYMVRYQAYQLRADKAADASALQLATSNSTLESVMRTIPDIVFRLDSMGTITFISPAISRYHIPEADLIGKSIFSLVAPEDLERSRYRLNERRTGSRATTDLELRLQLPGDHKENGETVRFFSLSAEGMYRRISNEENQFLGTQGIVRDINQRKLLEQQLQQAQKMEVIGNMASGIAHDLNNILSGIVSYPDLIILELKDGDPLLDKIKIIQKSGQDAAAIVQDLLTLARRSMDVSRPCNLNQIINEYLESPVWLEKLKPHPEIQLCLDLDPDLPNVNGSRIHLSKVVMNLLLNAVEAMVTGGELSITTRKCTTESDRVTGSFSENNPPSGDLVQLVIADQGIGIPKPDLSRIFEPFYSRKKMGSSGSGLGMTIVWSTIREHGGHVDISSKEGFGTEVTILLPATRRQIKDIDDRFDFSDWLGNETILLVDDNPEQLHIGAGMLEKLGYSVRCARGGSEAVSIAQETHFDLLLLDMIMPGGPDGLETYQQILEFRPGQRAVVATGFSESDRISEIRKVGVRFCISKPYSLKKLAQAVRSELDRNPDIPDLVFPAGKQSH